MATRIEDAQYQPPALWIRVLETLLLTLAVPALGWAINPGDPFFLQEPFAWLIAGPLLVGLRYGFAFALSSALLLALLALSAGNMGIGEMTISLHYIVGLILLAMVTGEFTDVWHRRLRQMAVINHQQSTRLNEFVRNYHLLRTSHDQLAERIAANPYNLRDALLHLNQRFNPAVSEPSMLAFSGDELLNFLAWHTKIQQAALYSVDETGRIMTPAIANIGGEPGFDIANHPMVRECLKKQCMISLKEALIEEMELGGSDILAAVPLIDVNERIWAVAVVTDVPFIMFHHNMLDLLAILGANLGDLIREAKNKASVWASDSDALFIERIKQWSLYKRHYKLESLLMCVHVPETGDPDLSRSIIDLLLGQLRGLDYPAVFDSKDGYRKTLAILMPLTDSAGAEPYEIRISQMLREQLGIEPTDHGITFQHQLIAGKLDARALLDEIRE